MITLAAVIAHVSLLAGSPSLESVQRGDVTLLTDVAPDSRDAVFDEARFARRVAGRLISRLELKRKSRDDLRLRVFAREAGYEDWKRRTADHETQVSTRSFYDAAKREVVSSWSDGGDDARAQLRRQVARQTLLQYAKNPPNWLEEGFAGYVEGATPDPFGDVLGLINAPRLEVLRRALERDAVCPLFELMDRQDIDFYGLAGASESPWPRSVLYAQSWSLFFYLIESGDPGVEEFLERVARRAESGRWDQDAYRDALADMDASWRATLLDTELAGRGDALRNAWTALYEDDPIAAQADAAAALRRNPESRSARRVLARARFAVGEFEESGALFEALASERDDDDDAALSWAISRLRLAEETQSRADALRAAETAERVADRCHIASKPAALVAAAEAAELAGDVKEALRHVRRALRLRGVSKETTRSLKDHEERLVRRAIGRRG